MVRVMDRNALDHTALMHALHSLPEWCGDGSGLRRRYRFADFATAIRFMGDCVADIEELNHHPEWCNVYDRVDVLLRTHSAGNRVSQADIALASALEARAQSFSLLPLC